MGAIVDWEITKVSTRWLYICAVIILSDELSVLIQLWIKVILAADDTKDSEEKAKNPQRDFSIALGLLRQARYEKSASVSY